MDKAKKEGYKTFLRYIVLAVLPVAVQQLAGISTWWAILVIAVLAGVDNFMHRNQKIDLYQNTSLANKDNGITPF